MTATALAPSRNGTGFRHDALFYSGLDEFVAESVAFVNAGLDRDEPVLVVVNTAKIAALKAELGSGADGVLFLNMTTVGRNPACIIPAWHQFVTEHVAEGQPARGIGEPVWRGRTTAELTECYRHEALLNLAFADTPTWWLRCPYDTSTLDERLIAAAHCTHPHLAGREHTASASYPGLAGLPSPFDGELPPPAGSVITELAFQTGPLDHLRRTVARRAGFGGLSPDRAADLVLAANEIASNSIVHGGGAGMLRIWHDDNSVVCEVTDAGHLTDPMTGRRLPTADQQGGRGLWMTNHLCDLVQIRSSPGATAVRLFMDRP